MLCEFLNWVLKGNTDYPLYYPETSGCTTYNANHLAVFCPNSQVEFWGHSQRIFLFSKKISKHFLHQVGVRSHSSSNGIASTEMNGRKLPWMLLVGHAKGMHHPSHLDKADSYSKVLWKHSQFLYFIAISFFLMKITWHFNEGTSAIKKLRLFNSLIILVLNLPWDLHLNVFQKDSCLQGQK